MDDPTLLDRLRRIEEQLEVDPTLPGRRVWTCFD
jgi:hypothetical protein